MPVQLSTMITRLQKEAMSAADSGRTHAVDVADLVTPRLAPLVPDGEPVPDLVGFQLGLVALIEQDHERLLEIDARHVAELSADREARRERDLAFEALYDQLSAVQEAWNGVYVEGGPLLFDGVELLPEDPVALHRLGERVHGRLANAELAEPELRLAEQSLNREALATALLTRVERLGTALASVSGNRKSSDGSLRAKQEAFEGLRRTVRFAAGCLAGLYGLAGLDDLAEKVRPKRRASRRSKAGADGSPDGGTPPDGGPNGSSETSPGAETEGGSEKTVTAGATGDGPPASGPIGIVS